MLVVQERDGNNLALVSYTRGNDLSGSRQGAGGIGGLLARTDHALLSAPGALPFAHAYFHSDGNGNVTALVDTNGFIVARDQYDPYGNLLGIAGPLAEANTYRFSSKEWHANAGLYYYGFRHYEPNLQRWLNRDPIEEFGGFNLYTVVGNSPIGILDLFGLQQKYQSPWYLRWFVPGQVAWDNAVNAWYEGDKSTAASWGLMMIAEQALSLAGGKACQRPASSGIAPEILKADAKAIALESAFAKREAASNALKSAEKQFDEAQGILSTAAENLNEAALNGLNSEPYRRAKEALNSAQQLVAFAAQHLMNAKNNWNAANAAANAAAAEARAAALAAGLDCHP
jgi:RHS repeat-associated protein